MYIKWSDVVLGSRQVMVYLCVLCVVLSVDPGDGPPCARPDGPGDRHDQTVHSAGRSPTH